MTSPGVDMAVLPTDVGWETDRWRQSQHGAAASRAEASSRRGGRAQVPQAARLRLAPRLARADAGGLRELLARAGREPGRAAGPAPHAARPLPRLLDARRELVPRRSPGSTTPPAHRLPASSGAASSRRSAGPSRPTTAARSCRRRGWRRRGNRRRRRGPAWRGRRRGAARRGARRWARCFPSRRTACSTRCGGRSCT